MDFLLGRGGSEGGDKAWLIKLYEETVRIWIPSRSRIETKFHTKSEIRSAE